MKIKCTKCAANCTIEMDVDIKPVYVDLIIPCIANKDISAEWKPLVCPECESVLHNNNCNCQKRGL